MNTTGRLTPALLLLCTLCYLSKAPAVLVKTNGAEVMICAPLDSVSMGHRRGTDGGLMRALMLPMSTAPKQGVTSMPGQLSATTRVVDLIHTLPEPSEYIRNVLGNFVSYGYDPETCKIRIGIKGAGVAPNYKIEKPSYLQTLSIKSNEFTFTVTPAGIFNGRNHREMVEFYDLERCDQNWSCVTSTFTELKDLLGCLMQDGTLQ